MPQTEQKSSDNVLIPHTQDKSYFFIKQPSDVTDIQRMRRYDDNHLKPVIDLTGEFKDFADLSVNPMALDALAKIEEISHMFAARRRELPETTQTASDETIRFLSWLLVSQKDFNLKYDSSSQAKLGVSSNPFAPVDDAGLLANRLYERSFLSRKFFDRFHQCGSCGSTKLNVREECMTCRSADIEEVQIIHHFACAWQGPESDYIQGRDLVCPKCKQHLTHYGSDYEKSGIVMHCNDCSDDHSTAAVGFICLDCESHQDSETMKTITHYDYALTKTGIRFVTTSQPDTCVSPPVAKHQASISSHSISACKEADNTLHVSSLPLELQQEIIAVRLGVAPSRHEGIQPFVLMEFSYSNAFALILQLGENAFTKLRHRLHDNMRAIIREHDVFSQGMVSDYLLLKETDKETIAAKNSTFLERCQHEIDHDLGIVLRIFDGKELIYSE